MKLFQTGQTTAISHGALFTPSLFLSVFFPFLSVEEMIFGKETIAEGNNFFFFPDVKFFHWNLIGIIGTISATG